MSYEQAAVALLERGYKWNELKNFTRAEIKFLYKHTPAGLSNIVREQIMLSEFYASWPGQRAENIKNELNRLRNNG